MLDSTRVARVGWLLLFLAVGCGTRQQSESTPAPDSGGAAGNSGNGGAAGSGGLELGGSDSGPPPPPIECSPPPIAAADPPVGVPNGVVADFALQGSKPRVAIGPNGDAAVIWSSSGVLRARLHRSGAWLAGEAILKAEPDPSWAALGADGRLLAVAVDPKSPQMGVLCARELTVDGSWSDPRLIGVAGTGWWQEPSPPALAFGYSSTNDVIALFRAMSWSGGKSPTGVFATRSAAGTGFDAPVQLDDAIPDQLGLVVQPNGDAVATWGAQVADVVGSTFGSGGWQASEALGIGTRLFGVAADASGGTCAVGARYVGPASDVLATCRGANGAWGTPTKLGDVAEQPLYGFVAGDGSGRLLAAWTSWGPGCAFESSVSMRDATGVWQPPQSLSGAPQGATSIAAAALAPSGHAIVAWNRTEAYSTNSCDDLEPHFTWFAPGVGWLDSELLDADAEASNPSVALSPTGSALLAWEHQGLVLVRWIDPP